MRKINLIALFTIIFISFGCKKEVIVPNNIDNTYLEQSESNQLKNNNQDNTNSNNPPTKPGKNDSDVEDNNPGSGGIITGVNPGIQGDSIVPITDPNNDDDEIKKVKPTSKVR
ncbi:MAG: hypothetical protein WC994_07050 [Brumimicrobium sp.]